MVSDFKSFCDSKNTPPQSYIYPSMHLSPHRPPKTIIQADNPNNIQLSLRNSKKNLFKRALVPKTTNYEGR